MKKTLFRFLVTLIIFLINISPLCATSQAPDYSEAKNWVCWEMHPHKDASLFLLAPSVDTQKAHTENIDITDKTIRRKITGTINMERPIYAPVCDIYAPFYRQAQFGAYLNLSACEPVFDTAYADVRDAFLFFLTHTPADRPLFLAGFSQGSQMLIRLLKEFGNDPAISDRLVAAYAIGWPLTAAETDEYPWLKPAQTETDTGVIITFNTEAPEIEESLLVGKNMKTFAINPLNWKTDSSPADKTLNKGACFTNYSGIIKKEIPMLTGAYIDEKRGTLKVTDITPDEYPVKVFPLGVFHFYDYQFFFRNLQENVRDRLSAFKN